VSVGSELAQARRDAGLSVAQVSAGTNIRASLIDQIEVDDFSHCGGDFYARGHIRAIAKFVGLDSDEAMREFASEHTVTAPSATQVFEAETSTKRLRRSGPNWSAAMALALVVIVAFGVYKLANSHSSSANASDTQISQSSLPSVSNTPSANTSPSPSQSTSPQTSASAGSNVAPTNAVAYVPSDVVVLISADNGSCWMSVTSGSGKSLFQGLLSQGASRTFRDDAKIKVLLGSAGAVNMTVNGYDIGSPGGKGQVVRLSYGPGNPTASPAASTGSAG
jgi:cytoskeleton protein RodZ